MGVYLELYHGRKPRNQELNDWGSQGPIFGPMDFVTMTYACHIRLISRDGAHEWDIWMDKDLVFYDGVWYGDWAVMDTKEFRSNPEYRKRLVKFEEAKTKQPEKTKRKHLSRKGV